jgi:HEAT repeat protein
MIIDVGRATVSDETRRSKEKESRVRASVAWALGQIGDAAARDTLLKAVNDPNSLVRDAALEALARINEVQDAKQLAADAATATGSKPTPAPSVP